MIFVQLVEIICHNSYKFVEIKFKLSFEVQMQME